MASKIPLAEILAELDDVERRVRTIKKVLSRPKDLDMDALAPAAPEAARAGDRKIWADLCRRED